jgi:DNA replication regulator DPB11
LWENILGPRGFEVVDGKLKRSPSKCQSNPDYNQIPLSPTKPKTQSTNTTENGSVLSNFKRANSFAIKPKEETRRRPFTQIATAGVPTTLLVLQREAQQPVASSSKLPTEPSRKEGVFSGKKFRALGEANTDNVKSVVEGEDGFWVTDELEDVDFTVVRLVSLVFPHLHPPHFF